MRKILQLPFFLERNPESYYYYYSTAVMLYSPLVGVSSLDLGPHGNPVAALFFCSPTRITPGFNHLSQGPEQAAFPANKTCSAQNCDENVTCPWFEQALRADLRARPCSTAISDIPLGCPIRGVSSLDLGRRPWPRGPFSLPARFAF